MVNNLSRRLINSGGRWPSYYADRLASGDQFNNVIILLSVSAAAQLFFA